MHISSVLTFENKLNKFEKLNRTALHRGPLSNGFTTPTKHYWVFRWGVVRIDNTPNVTPLQIVEIRVILLHTPFSFVYIVCFIYVEEFKLPAKFGHTFNLSKLVG